MLLFAVLDISRYIYIKYHVTRTWPVTQSGLLIRTFIRGWVNFLRRKGRGCHGGWIEKEREGEKKERRQTGKHKRRGSPNKIVVKLASSSARAGLRLRPQINDRDARDKITSRIKERRYVPITSTYLRDRSVSPRRLRIGVSLPVLFMTQRGVPDRILPRANRKNMLRPRFSNGLRIIAKF